VKFNVAVVDVTAVALVTESIGAVESVTVTVVVAGDPVIVV
jgi:hypothetical protein